MTTFEYGWYRCPTCRNKTAALDESGDHPDCADCQAAAAPTAPPEPEDLPAGTTTVPNPTATLTPTPGETVPDPPAAELLSEETASAEQPPESE